MHASTEGLGILTLLADFGCADMRASVGMDASAAIGIVQRQVISKLRDVEVDVLWVQEQQARKLLPLRKVPGPRKPSDMGTKHIAVALMDRYLQQMNLEVVEGRSATAQHLHAAAPGDHRAEDGRACDLEIPLHRPAMNPRNILGAQVGPVGHGFEPIERHGGRSSRLTGLQVGPTVTSA